MKAEIFTKTIAIEKFSTGKPQKKKKVHSQKTDEFLNSKYCNLLIG